MSKPIETLFLCTNCIVRSPIAAALSRKLTKESVFPIGINFEAGGSYAGSQPRPPDLRAIKVSKEHGIDISQFSSFTVTAEQLKRFNFIFALDEDSFWFTKPLLPMENIPQLKMFMEFSLQLGLREVPDPVLGAATFEEVYLIIEQNVPRVLEYIKHQLGY